MTITTDKPRLRHAEIDCEYWPYWKIRGWVCSFAGISCRGWSAEDAYLKLMKAVDADKESKAWVQRTRRKEGEEGRARWHELTSPTAIAEAKPLGRLAWWKPGARWLP